MNHVGALPRPRLARWARTRHAAYRDEAVGGAPSTSLPRKDFSAIPVCGAVRPAASQRELARSDSRRRD